MKNSATRYIERIYKLAKVAAEEYKDVRNAPFEVPTGKIRLTKERYIKWSWCMWGALQALGFTDDITQEEYEEYEEWINKLDNIAYEEE